MSRPLASKLCVKEGDRIAILNPPLGYGQIVGELPDNVTITNSLEGEFNLIHFFVIKRKKLEEGLSQLKDALREDGLLWVSYPKGSQLNTNINRESIAAYARSLGLKAVTQVSVDHTWSALRFKVVD